MTEPTPVELKAIIGLLIVENDAWRESRGMVMGYGRRTYEPERIEEAKKLCTQVIVNPGGCLVAKVES